MDLRWLHVSAAHVLLLMSFSKIPSLTSEALRQRNFQQLNMGFGKGSSCQTRRGGLECLGNTDQRDGHREGGPEGPEKGPPLGSQFPLRRGAGRTVELALRSKFTCILLITLGSYFPTIQYSELGIGRVWTGLGPIYCDSAV